MSEEPGRAPDGPARAPRGERARVARLRAIFAAGRGASGVEVDIGDDAAVLAPAMGHEVLSVDAHVEGVHFRRGWLSVREIGARAAAAALSDLAAMGAEARAVLLSLALPAWIDDEALDALAVGVRDAADEAGARVVGGNLARASELSLHTTVIGRMSATPLLRRGAMPGHGVFVTGTLGSAALGLAALGAGRADHPLLAPHVARWRRPRPRLVEGRRLAEVASAAIDVSDGLAGDLAHVAEASGVGILLDASELPFAPGFAASCAVLDRDPVALALSGGEDYELAFTAPISKVAGELATRIGVVLEGPGGVEVRDSAGRRVAAGGFDHFG
jgi:thiamine-monophosphate kinase